jgi:hypothetical protein
MAGKRHREFVAAVSTGDGLRWKTRGENAADRANGFSARQVAMDVVDRFQPIDIEDEHRERDAGRL